MPNKICVHAKSDMTPCVLKDGAICFAMDSQEEPICVGCERTPAQLGVPKPADWAKTVADYKTLMAVRRARADLQKWK